MLACSQGLLHLCLHGNRHTETPCACQQHLAFCAVLLKDNFDMESYAFITIPVETFLATCTQAFSLLLSFLSVPSRGARFCHKEGLMGTELDKNLIFVPFEFPSIETTTSFFSFGHIVGLNAGIHVFVYLLLWISHLDVSAFSIFFYGFPPAMILDFVHYYCTITMLSITQDIRRAWIETSGVQFIAYRLHTICQLKGN